MQRPTHGGNIAWAARLAGCSPDAIVDFSASINPLGPPHSAIAAIQRGLKSLSAYPDPNYTALRTAIAQFHHFSPAWILPGNGAAELLTWAGWELAQCAVTYFPTPAFSDYKRALQAFSGQFEPCPLSLEDYPSLACLPASPPQPSGLILNNPHNPTGHLWTVNEILPLLDSFDLVVVDEAFMDFLAPSEQESLVPYVPQYPQLVVLRSLTKFYSLPGLRLGYAVAHPDRLQRWQTMRDPWSVNCLAEHAGVAVLQDTIFQQQTWNWLPLARSMLFEELQYITGLSPLNGYANFLLVESEMQTSRLQAALLRQSHILIRDCLSFPELGDRYFRIAIRTERENQQLLNALRWVMGG
ncbi:MAG: threonine-phosphate decarboxylase [Kamptonema sp. SIO4C4]|nr:threonine-phosphate decarboxylase [Kamptonema sp. SIO4C4]